MNRHAVLLLVFVCTFLVSGVEVSLAEENRNGKEHLTMEGVEIQGTIEKPHAVYVIPWGEIQGSAPENRPLGRSFREEIIKPVEWEQFQRQHSRMSTSVKGGSK